jgi:hypothetical protein
VSSSLGRLRSGAERICFLQLRFDRGAPDRRCRRKLRAQLVPLFCTVSTSPDFGGMQTSTHDGSPLNALTVFPLDVTARRRQLGDDDKLILMS